jgi:hypothetical protein
MSVAGVGLRLIEPVERGRVRRGIELLRDFLVENKDPRNVRFQILNESESSDLDAVVRSWDDGVCEFARGVTVYAEVVD